MKKIQNYIIGFALIAIGTLLTTNALGLTTFNLFFEGWWTLFIIVPCSINLLFGKDKIGSIIGVLIGIILLLNAREILEFSQIREFIIPAIIIIVGLSFIFKSNKNNNSNSTANDITTVFGEDNIKLTEVDDKKKSYTAIFGAMDIDLTKIQLEKDITINVTTLFGGIDVFVPKNINIKTNSTAIFGEVSNATSSNVNENTKTITINAVCIFGGIDIVNK